MTEQAAYRPKFGYDIRIKPDLPRRRSGAAHVCATLGCGAEAQFNVPKTRYDLHDRHWLCTEHLRANNAQWDFFAGMSEQEIYSFRVEAITGHRPTWPLGKRAAEKHANRKRETGWAYYFDDGFAIFEEAEPAQPKKPTRLTKGQIDALTILNLEEGATLHDIKARYKELVKRYHPDANGGDRGAEERLKQVIRAYGHLRATGLA
jgi:DnaJ-domain-containing protein 1